MNQGIQFKIVCFLIAVSIIFIGISCESPMKDVPVELSTAPLINTLNIQVVDANESTYTPIPDNAIVTISGKDAVKIHSLDGFEALRVENGFINIGLLRADTLNLANQPLEFMLTVKANGYIDGRMNYRIATTDAQIATLRMINKDPNKAPRGVVIQEKTFTVVDTTTEVRLNAAATNGREESAEVILKSGTKLFDKDGKPVTGTVTATMVSFDASSPESLRAFPGGLNYSGSKDSAGTNTGGGTFTTFGFMALSMSVGNTDVKSFSKPLEVSMELNDKIGRSDSAGSALQAGQSIPVWSLNETNGEWQVENLAKVAATGASGKLKATFAQSHLSWWNLDDPTCWYLSWWLGNGRQGVLNALGCASCGNPTMKIRSPNTTGNPNGGSRFYVEILNGKAPANPGMVIHSYYDDLVNNSNVYFTNYLGGVGTGVNENQWIRFRVFDRPGGQLLNPTTANTLYRPCNRANPIIDLSAMMIPPVPVTINIDFSGLGSQCGSPNLLIKPTTTFYYKDVSLPNSAWLPWGLMRNGIASSSVLLRGKTYKFAVFHSKLNFETTRMGVLVAGAPAGTIKIPATQGNIIINLDATSVIHSAWELKGNIYLKQRTGTDIYDLTDTLTSTTMRRYPFSKYTCDKFKAYF